MMQRGLSAENIADFAHHAVSSLRRLVSSSSLHDATLTPSQQDLLSTTKQIEEASHRKTVVKVDGSVVELWARSFADELECLVSYLQDNMNQSQTDGSTSSSSVGTPKAPLPTPTVVHRKPLADSQLLQANDCTKILLRMMDRAAADFMYHARLFDALLRVIVNCASMLSKRLVDSLVGTIADCLSDFPFVLEGTVAQTVVEVLDATEVSDMLNPQRIRLLYLLSNALKRIELAFPVSAKSVKARLQSLGLTSLLIRQCRLLQAFFDQESTRHGLALTALILSLVNVSCIARGTQEIKQLVLAEDIQTIWTLGVNNIHKMDCVVAYQSSLSIVSSNKTEERLITFDNTTIWAAELAEMLVELCTSASFSLQRQMLYVESGPLPSTPPTSRDVPSGPILPPAVMMMSRRWEPLPQNWDTTLSSGAPMVWRLASTLLACHFSVDSVKSLFRFLRNLDTSHTLAEYVYRSVVATVLLLCHGSPSNVDTLSKAGALNLLIESLTDADVTAFPHGTHRRIGMSRSHSGSFDAAATPPSAVTVALTRLQLSEGSRSMAMALLSVLATALGDDDIRLLTDAVDLMRTNETTAEDCEVIEHMLHTISGTVYARNAVFFSGDASVVCPVERFVGRWYGYTFVTWVNPLCVWGEGCHLFSFSDPSTPSSVVVSVVANGRSRSLAVRSLNGMDFSITLLPDTTLSPDGWTHLAIVHNISGFFVYINGRKSSCNVSVAFPKEPRKSQLLYFGLGGAEQPNSSQSRSMSQVAVPSLFGFTASMEVWDGQISEKDLDRLVAAGPCSSIGMEPPVCSTPPLLFVNSTTTPDGDVELEVGGAIVKKEAVRTSSAVAHRNADVPTMFTTLQVVDWAVESIRSLVGNPTPNRNTIAVLCCEFICTAFRIATKEKVLAKYHEAQTIENIRRSLLDWEAPVPHQLAQCLLALTVPRSAAKRMRSHPTTAAVLDLLLDVMGSRQCSSAFYCATFKELSELFSVPENAKVFREDSSRFNSVLLLTQFLPSEAIDDYIALVEKLCKEPVEVECLLRFITFDEASKKSEVIRCESLRMLFDTARPNVALCDMIANAFNGNGVWWLLHIIEGSKHHSEAVRVYAIRLLALILHCSKRARETFAKGNGFELLGAALTSCAAMTTRLMTFNCLFKFALDFFQPTADRSDAALARLHGTAVAQPARHIDPRGQASGASLGFHGHLPGLLPGRTGRREYSFDFGMGSECGDVEGRLSVDENYSSQTVSKDLLVHPQVVQIILSMVGRMLTTFFREPSEVVAHAADDRVELMSSEEHHSATSLTTSRRDEDSPENVVLKIFAYLDRIVDMTPNAVAMLNHPWMEWIWAAFEPVMTASQRDNCSTSQRNLAMAAETQVRSIVRKISVVDLSRPTRSSNLKRIKELVDEPSLQRILFEEVVRHFSANNRLDTMEPNDATNVIRNVDTLFQGIEEALSPMPSALGVEIALAIRDIAVNNNMWVRLKMKNNTKLFETRDRLAFSLLSSIRLFSHETSQLLQDLVHVNQHDPNAMIVILKDIVDAVSQRNLEEVETLQSMLRHLYSLDDEQRKCLQRILETDSVELLVLPHQRGDVQKSDSRASNGSSSQADGSSTSSQDFISWCMANDGKWEAMTFKILRSSKTIENEAKSSSERRDKERNAKLRSRKTEAERRAANVSKVGTEFEKIKSEVDSKGMSSFVDSVAEAKNARKVRDLVILASPSKN